MPSVTKSKRAALDYIGEVTCARATRELIRSAYPAVENDTVLWRALVYLLFGASFDRKTNGLLFGEAVAEWVCGRALSHGRGSHPVFMDAEDVLQYVQSNLLPDFRWSSYSYAEGRVREVVSTGIRGDVEEAVFTDLATSTQGQPKRVFVLDGQVFRPASRTAKRKERLAEAAKVSLKPASPTSGYFLKRLNDGADRPLKGFTALAPHFQAAIDAALIYVPSGHDQQCAEGSKHTHQIHLPATVRTRLYQTHLLRTLRMIEDSPQPFYRPSKKGNTDRVFEVSPSLLSLPGAIRHTLTDGGKWQDLDLASAHLAIAASLWGISDLRALLESGQSAWSVMISDLGMAVKPGEPGYATVKQILKTATYSAVYGMGVNKLNRQITCEMEAAGFDLKGPRVMRLSIFAQLLAARRRAYSDLKTNGIGVAPSGIRIKKKRAIRKQMSTLAQSYEAVLVEPILRYEEDHLAAVRASGMKQPDFRVMLWQHDGCSVRFDKNPTGHLAAMQEAVKVVADKYDIPTRLEVKG